MAHDKSQYGAKQVCDATDLGSGYYWLEGVIHWLMALLIYYCMRQLAQDIAGFLLIFFIDVLLMDALFSLPTVEQQFVITKCVHN